MRQWIQLDMRKKLSMPPIDALVILHFVPNDKCTSYRKNRQYDIGRFERKDESRKAWWHGSRNVENLAQLRQYYTIWWYIIREDEYYSWVWLNMRSKASMPPIGALVALRLVPNNERATFYNEEEYDIGQFKTDVGSRKAWWYGPTGVRNPTRLHKHYNIWWYPVPMFDGI